MKKLSILFALALGGCATTGSVESLKPVCDALVKPYKYNTFKTTSLRHAGSELAKDLKQHNQIGSKLGCPQF